MRCLALLALCAAAQAWSIKDRGAGIDSVETTFQTRLKGGGKGVTLTYVLAACGDEVGELEEDVREDEGAKYLDATELHAAAFGGRADCCEKLVARGDAVDARLNTTNWTPMHVAAQGGNAAVVEYLLGQGADPVQIAAIAVERLPVALRVQQADQVGDDVDDEGAVRGRDLA